jgi:hypothetical protein
MSDREFGGNDDLSLPKGGHSYALEKFSNANVPSDCPKDRPRHSGQ